MSDNDTITAYFKQIETLLDDAKYSKDIFLDQDMLLIKKQNTTGIEKVNVLLDLYEATRFKSIKTARGYNEEALELAQAIGFQKGELTAKYNHAYLLFVSGLFDRSMSEVEKIEEVVEYDRFPECYADLKTLKSYIYTERGEYDLALEIGFELLDFAERTQKGYLFLKAYFALSHYYLRTENYSISLKYCFEGLHYIIKLKKTQYLFSKIDEIARLTAKLNNPKGALDIYAFCLRMEPKIPSTGNYIKSAVFMNMAEIYMQIGEYGSAQQYLDKALMIINKDGYKFRVPRILILQAELFLLKNDTVASIGFYEKSLEAAEEINAFDVVKSNSLILAQLYKKQNNLTKTYEYNNLYAAIRDSYFNNEKEQKIIILETRRKVNEVTQMNRILELENKVQQDRFNFVIVVLILVSFICLIVALSYFKARKKNKMLYRHTLELATMQTELKQKIQDYRKTFGVSNDYSGDVSVKKCQTIDEETKNLILHRLNKLEAENFFLDPHCNLNDVSVRLKTNSKYLSQVINLEKKTNFNNYINDLRINYLLSRLLVDGDFRNSKLNYIAASAGFNSINTFKAAFKKRQGILPSYFIGELNSELQKRGKA
ncbi:helix-turn-helix domain-containing protein [Maribellus sp. CM-23]|uniref:AraC family transcriptional regulator n=1 Tax=Maribellus sp. CM-23 TaxID=2781026 RepID=UPI001F20AFBB|nr:AraC family transcriptional regulator [Maribellus sp. CM-23]MCE4566750.1 helix-turn-helix domain-containing protein [Maribellus sp. CM-23]